MLDNLEKCSLCGELIDKRGMGSHKGSNKCRINAIKREDSKVGWFKMITVDSLMGNPVCDLCEEKIGEGDVALV